MTDFERIILFALFALVIIILLLLIINFILDRKKKTYNFKDELNHLEISISSYLNSSLLDMTNKVNNQLITAGDIQNKNISELKEKMAETISLFQEKLNNRFNFEFKELTESIDKRMLNINEKVDQRLQKGFLNANDTFVNIAKRVEVIDEAQKNIQALSEEMISLKNILSNNQARGSFGEYQLNQLLYSIFGDNKKLYQIQYTIRDDNQTVRADAVIFMPEPNGMIAIDSKFPYSSYAKLFDNKNLLKEEEDKLITQFGSEIKKHITDIAKKYINPPLTTEYALMFVPSDGILTLIHSQLKNIVDYARSKYVTIVSPTTIIPLLSSFKAFIIDSERNKYTKLIKNELIKLSKEFTRFETEWQKLANNIENLKKNSDSVNSRVEKINNKFYEIKNVGISPEIENEIETKNEPDH
ncbi:MAG: DNA recombination protein RmuC [Candidatus Izemoplasmatales bacterium]